MDEAIQDFRSFLQRTDFLASRLDVTIRELAPYIGISERTLFASRKADSAVSNKTWLKLVAAEKRHGDGHPRIAVAQSRDDYEKDSILKSLPLIDRLLAYPLGSQEWVNEFEEGVYQAETDWEAFLENVRKLTQGVLAGESDLSPLAKKLEWQSGDVERVLKHFFLAMIHQPDPIAEAIFPTGVPPAGK